jgi:protein-S-isoprenylcysteine O-methyltransferase Ste14
MLLLPKIVHDGQNLFRWRSYIPLLLLPLILLACPEAERVEKAFGAFIHHIGFFVCLFVSFTGLAIRWFTVGYAPSGTSGRNTRYQRADALNTTGLYSIVRNPLYLGNYLAIIGVVLSLMVWWLPVIVTLLYWLYIERVIAAEEAFLSEKFGASYFAWAENVPTFLPKWSLWTPPETVFSFKRVMRREYNGVLAVAVSFFILEGVLDILFEHESFADWFSDDKAWFVVLLVCAVLFLVLRYLKKKTGLLRVQET